MNELKRQRARRLANAARKAREWLGQRDDQIVQAHQAGDSFREIGRAVGLSHQAVKKIVPKRAAAALSTASDDRATGKGGSDV